MALPMDFEGYARMADREPRLLAIMETIQGEARSRRAEKMKEIQHGAGNRGKATHPIPQRRTHR